MKASNSSFGVQVVAGCFPPGTGVICDVCEAHYTAGDLHECESPTPLVRVGLVKALPTPVHLSPPDIRPKRKP